MRIINVIVEDKKARTVGDPLIICGNSDYHIEFTFDAEWEEEKVKTARFVHGSTYTDVVFEGNRVQVPVLQRVRAVLVGVYAGKLRTTTPASINCKQSILCNGGLPQEPPQDVYNQLISLIGAGMLKGEQGEQGERGEKGEPGAVKMKIVQELPTTDIKDDTIYLLPSTSSEEQNIYDEYIYANGWERIGNTQIDLSDYVKKDQLATNTVAGLIAYNSQYGMQRVGATLVPLCWDTYITNRQNAFMSYALLDKAVKAGVTTNTETLTDEEKTRAREWIGAVGAEDYATNVKGGVVKVIPSKGISLDSNGVLILQTANERIIDQKSSAVYPLVPKYLDYAVKVALTTNTITLTEEEKAAVKAWLGL